MRTLHTRSRHWLFILTATLSAAAWACSGSPDPGTALADATDSSTSSDAVTDDLADTSPPPSDTTEPGDTHTTSPDTTEPPTDTTEPPTDTSTDATDAVDMTDMTMPGCPTGLADCDGDPNNGCEATLATSVEHCGACDNACPMGAGSTPLCASGACSISTCDEGLADCDGEVANGCEVDTTADVTHCGGCAMTCTLSGATAACVESACAIDSCDTDFADCDDDTTNGCEIVTDMDPDHCGACDNACPEVANGTRACTTSTCEIGACYIDFDDCDGDLATGCETALLDDEAHCGACDNACPVPPNATAMCAQGVCGMGGCQPGWLDVDGDETNGCEVQVTESTIALSGVTDFTVIGDTSTTSGPWSIVAHTDGSSVWTSAWLNATGTDKTIASGLTGARVDRASHPSDAAFVAQDGTEFVVGIPSNSNAVAILSEPTAYCTSGCAAQGLGTVAGFEDDSWQTIVTSGSTLSWYHVGYEPVAGKTCETTPPFGFDRCLMNTMSLSNMSDIDLRTFSYSAVVGGTLTTVKRLMLAVARTGRVDFYLLNPSTGAIDSLGLSVTGLPQVPVQVELLPLGPGGSGFAVGYTTPGGIGTKTTARVLVKRFSVGQDNYPTGIVDAHDHAFSNALGDVILDDLHAIDGRNLVASHHTVGTLSTAGLELISEAQVVRLDGNGFGETGQFEALSSTLEGDHVIALHSGSLRVYELTGLP